MNHEPYYREGTGRDAVLLIHGIAGSPGHFRDLIPIIPREYSIYNILLDGHNGTPRDFGRSSMARWKTQVDNTLQALFSCHEQVVIVAHSMGALFAIQAAISHPDRIPALFLLNVPTRPRVHPRAMLAAVQVAFGHPRTATAHAMHNDTGISLTLNPLEYIRWAPRMVELLAECRKVRSVLSLLTVPAQVFLSRSDELVSLRSRKDLVNPCMQTTLLAKSGHYAYGNEDTLLLQDRLRKTLENLTIRKKSL